MVLRLSLTLHWTGHLQICDTSSQGIMGAQLIVFVLAALCAA